MRAYTLSHEHLAYGQALRRLRQRRNGSFKMVIGAALLLVLGIIILGELDAPDPTARTATSQAALPPAPQPIWADIVQPLQLFNVSAPALAKDARSYAARRNVAGGGRQDILTFGQPNGPSPYLRLQLYRVGSEAAPAAPLYVDLARAAAQADLSIGRSLTPVQMPTRFGDFELADMELTGEKIPALPCLGFRGVALSGKFQISGFACGAKGKPIAQPALSCLIDRLDLNAAGDEKALAVFFAASELRRNPACAGTRFDPAATRASWLDRNDAPPPLKAKKLL